MKLIAQGAEAKLWKKQNGILKDRVRKEYRLKVLDDRLRKYRTKREAKVLEKLQALGFPSPKLLSNDEKEKLLIEEIKGVKVRDMLEKSVYEKISKEIGEKVSILHEHGIIHGDLTTSNMIFNKEVFFIDFGLSFFSEKVEDKAVDLHLLHQALVSKHHTIAASCFQQVLKGYKKKANDYEKVFKRLEQVESRGRNKSKK